MSTMCINKLPIDIWRNVFEKLDILSLQNVSLSYDKFAAIVDQLKSKYVPVVMVKEDKIFLSSEWNSVEKEKFPEVCLYLQKYNKCIELSEEYNDRKESLIVLDETHKLLATLAVKLQVGILVVCSTTIDHIWLRNFTSNLRISKLSSLVIYDCALNTQNVLSELLEAFRPSELSIQHLSIGKDQVTDEVVRKAMLTKLIIYNTRVPLTDKILDSSIELFFLTGGCSINPNGVSKFIKAVQLGERRLHSLLVEDNDLIESTLESSIDTIDGKRYQIQKGADFFYMNPQ